MQIDIVSDKKGLDAFIRFPWTVYESDPNWVPPLISEMEFVLGQAVALPSSTIHSVENDSGKPSISLHIYGKNVYYTGRSQFDVENKRELPWGKAST